MTTLRLIQISRGKDRYRVDIVLEGDALPHQTGEYEFDFVLSLRTEKMLWYLEEYLQYPQTPSPKIAVPVII